MGKILQRRRSRFVVRRVLTAVVGVACATTVLMSLDTDRGKLAAADDPPTASKDEAIARVERLGGEVRIDGEKPDQPVWAVDFQGSALVNQDLRILESFPALEALDLSDTAIDDEGLKYVVGCKRLKELDLSATKITDGGLSRLVELRELTTLQLNRTAITDDGLQRLAPLKKLSRPGVFETKVTEEGLVRLEAAIRSGAASTSSETPVASTGRRTAEIRQGATMETRREFVEKILTASSDGRQLNELGRLALIAADGDEPARDRAVELLERAVQADPTNDEFKLDLADAYAVLDLDLTLAAAVELYEEVLKRRPDDQQLLGRLVKAYSALENAPQAYEYAERRLNLVPAAGAYDIALQVVGIVAAGGKLERGIGLVRKAGEKNPDDVGVQLLLATLRIQAKDRTEASLILKRVLDRFAAGHPYHETAETLLSDLGKDP